MTKIYSLRAASPTFYSHFLLVAVAAGVLVACSPASVRPSVDTASEATQASERDESLTEESSNAESDKTSPQAELEAEGKGKSKGSLEPEPIAKNLPAQELTAQILYQILLAEIAVQRENFPLGASAYLDLAKTTRDPRIAQRAAQIAMHARDFNAALQASNLWVETDPESSTARQMLIGVLSTSNNLNELTPHITKLFSNEGTSVGASILSLSRLFANYPDKKAVLKEVEQVTEPYANLPETHFTRAHAAFNAGENQRGLESIDKALEMRPDWDHAVMLKSQLQRAGSPEKSVDTLRRYVNSHPKAREVRQQYASALASTGKFPEARAEFQQLMQDSAGNLDDVYAVAVLSLQLQDYTLAEETLRKLIENDYRESNSARFYLGQIEEERKKLDEAIGWYSKITAGPQYIGAQLRIARLLGQQGKLAEARQYLHQIKAADSDQHVQLVLAEAQLLREFAQPQTAYDFLEAKLAKEPNQPEILYESALLADKLGKYDVLETKLRKLIKLKPEHAHAYNALGYSFAERNQRLPEAQELINKALKISPDDPFIIDSLGWVLFRLGDNAAALSQLQRAFSMRSDPEIAAHLGEVLWASGQRDEARKVISEAVKTNPDNVMLLEVIKRLSL